MIMMMKEIKDLNKLIAMLIEQGYVVEEGMHAVLPDGSEIGVWKVIKEGMAVALLIAHYIDSHYVAIATLPENVDDTTFLRKLIECEASGIWRTPVEPVLFLSMDPALIRAVIRYEDSFPNAQAKDMYKHYLDHGSDRRVMTSILRRYERNIAKVFEELSSKQRE